MKRLISFLIVIAVSTSSQAQSSLVPDTIIMRVVDELIQFDGLKDDHAKTLKQVKLYEHSDSLNRVNELAYLRRIRTYKVDSLSFVKERSGIERSGLRRAINRSWQGVLIGILIGLLLG